MKFHIDMWSFHFILLLLSISSYGFLNLGFLPLNLSHLIVVFCLCSILIFSLYDKKAAIPHVYIYFICICSFFFVYSCVKIFDFQKIKNIINFIIFTAVTSIVLHNVKATLLIRYYIAMSKIFIFFALLQMFLYYFKIGDLYSFSFLGLKDVNLTKNGFLLRLYSIASEPAALCGILLPAVYLSINNLINGDKTIVGKKYSIILLFVFANTFSLIGYIYLLVMAVANIVYNGKVSAGKVIVSFIFIIFILFALFKSESMQERISGIVSVEAIESSQNLSVIAVYSNYLVSKKVLENDLLLGGGLFNHEYYYNKYIGTFYSHNSLRMELNKDDAASLYLRVISELGISGLIIFITVILWMLFNCNAKDSLKPFSIAFTLSFILLGIRAGSVNYVLLWFYFFSAFKFINYRGSYL